MSDIYFERDGGDADEDRAYTRIDFNRAVLGNRWLERTWSGFFGTTTSLLHRPGDSEWVTAQNPEFALVVDGELVEPMALGEIDVSEGCNDLGASLVIRKSRLDLAVTVTSTALHDVPAMVRGVAVMNTGSSAIVLDSVSSEMLEWEEKSGELVARRFFTAQSEPYECSSEDPCVALLHGNRAMLLGREEGGELHLNRPSLFQCNVVWPCGVRLEPMEVWRAPMSYVIASDGDPLATFLKEEARMVSALKLAERREAEVQEILDAEGENR